jgi:FkbM family methyltransferase
MRWSLRISRRLPPGLPWRLRVQFAVTLALTTVLRVLHLREPAIRLRSGAQRARRSLFERAGSTRYSCPAQHGMDRTLDALMGIRGGVFVEAGGHDGYTQYNTYYLERFRGWRGVLVEPMPEMAAEARRNRRGASVFQCALVAPDANGEQVEMEFGDLFTNVRGAADVETGWAGHGLVLGWRDPRVEAVPGRSLDAILDEAGVERIDLLSLDVEGYEPQVLSGLDLSRRAPAWLLVEMHDLTTGRAALGGLLGAHYVEHGQLSPTDMLYRRRDVSASSDSVATSTAVGEGAPVAG